MASLSKNKNTTFSDLPDCIIHHILSFLDKNKVSLMSFVSKRLFQSCLTSPYMSFIAKRCPQYHYYNDHCKLFYNRLKKFWSDRRLNNDHASMDIVRLHIEWDCKSCKFQEKYSVLVLDLVHDSVKLNVRELYLKLTNSFTIPLSMLSSDSLTVLELSCVYDWPFELVFPALRVLSLTGRPKIINKDDEGTINERISYSFPSLKKLCLLKFWEANLVIINSTLEELAIRINSCDGGVYVNIFTENVKTLSIDLPTNCSYRGTINVKIIAPKLYDFTFKAGYDKGKFEGEFLCLHKVSLELLNQCNYLLAVHRIVACATTLEMNFVTFEVLFKKCRQVLTKNVHNLVLKIEDDFISEDDIYIVSIIAFLKQFVNLESITIKHAPRKRKDYHYHDDDRADGKLPLGNYDINTEHIEPQVFERFELLKEVVVELNRGTKEIELVEYLLKFARNLERVTVFYSKDIFLMLARIDTRNFEIASKKMEFLFVKKEFVYKEER